MVAVSWCQGGRGRRCELLEMGVKFNSGDWHQTEHKSHAGG
jgi:hypothetical protein